MSIYKKTLQSVLATRNKLAKQIAETLPTSERSAYRILKGEKKLTVEEVLKLKVILNNALNDITEVANNL